MKFKLGWPRDAKDSKVFDSLNPSHDTHNLIGLILERLQVVTVDLRGELTLNATDSLFHVVLDGLGESPDYAGNLLQFPVHGCDEFFFVLVKARDAIVPSASADEVFGVEKAGRIRAVIRTPRLTGAFGSLRKRAKHYSGLVR